MSYSHSLRALVILLFVLPAVALAQQQPGGLSISPGVIYQPPGEPSCYRVAVGNAANMTVDITYTFQNGPTNTILDWPHLDANGVADICTDNLTAIGQYRFTGVRNTLTPNAAFQPVNAVVNVYAVPPQPTPGSMTFTPTQGNAGNDSYNLHFANAANLTIDLDFSLNGIQQPLYTLTVDGNGNWPYTLNHYDGKGLYEFHNMKNHLRADWVATGPTSSGVTYLVGQPKPKWLSTTPASVSAGSSWTMNVGNGALTTLDVVYQYNGGAEQTIVNWPVLAAISNGNPDGTASIPVGACSQTGTLAFTKIKNALANPNVLENWLTQLTNSVTINGSPAPVVTSLLPIAGRPGTAGIPLTITGRNLCNLSLTVSPSSGVTFGAIVTTPGGFTATTTVTVASGTSHSIVTVTATTPFGATSFPFYVASLQPPTVTGIAPDIGFGGTTGTITLTGTNLIGAALSSTWPGLSFKDATYSPFGTSMTAKAVIQATANTGTATVRADTPSGFSTVEYIIKTFFSTAKEYIRMGERVVAVETAAPTLPSDTTNTAPPTPPGSLTAIAPNPNAIVLQWLPASGTNGASIVQYELERDNIPAVTSVPAPALTVTESSAAILPAHTYTYRVVARDNSTPPLASARSNTVTITTPPETTPPTKPTLTYSNYGENWFYLEWSPSTDAGGSGLAGYRVCFGGDYGSVYDITGLMTDTAFGYEFPPELDFNLVYSIFVVAEDNAGNVSQPEIWWQR